MVRLPSVFRCTFSHSRPRSPRVWAPVLCHFVTSILFSVPRSPPILRHWRTRDKPIKSDGPRPRPLGSYLCTRWNFQIWYDLVVPTPVLRTTFPAWPYREFVSLILPSPDFGSSDTPPVCPTPSTGLFSSCFLPYPPRTPNSDLNTSL